MSGKYRPVSTAEKRAMLEAAGEEWPIGSDGLPMAWASRSDRPPGGCWRPLSQRRLAAAKYLATSQGRGKHRESERIRRGRTSLIGLPPLTPQECGRLAGRAAQDRYDRDPEAWARNKRAVREAGLKRTRTRLEGKASNG